MIKNINLIALKIDNKKLIIAHKNLTISNDIFYHYNIN